MSAVLSSVILVVISCGIR